MTDYQVVVTPPPAFTVQVGAGATGLSAYQLAVVEGFVGDEAAWLESLKGADGRDGADGVDGRDGVDGQDGAPGRDGVDGQDGAPGADGAPGVSAYQVAVDEGFVGSEADWLASLHGQDGEDGDPGPAATVTVGTVSLLTPGTPPTVTNTGTTSAAVLNFGIPAGNPTAYELRGTGFPEGVVTASVGTYYTDTAATNGAIRWVKATGTGTTGWKVLYGDTGWRNITSLIVSYSLPSEVWPVVSGALLIRRINDQVYTRVTGQRIVFDSTFTPSSFGAILAPTGFEPETGLMWPWTVWDKTTVYALYFSNSRFFPSSGPQSPLPQSSAARPQPTTSASWYTPNAWPTTLPGTPA